MPKPERTIRVEAVVLRHSDWGEADRLVTLFSREYGKLRSVAKGARRIKSRKAGHLEPFTKVALLLARGRDLWIITQAETVDAFLGLGADLVRTANASYVLELLDKITYDEGENRALYALLVETLQRLEKGEDPFLAIRYYEIRLLDLMGFRPELFQCVGCLKEIEPEDQFFSAMQGGVLCPACGFGASGAIPISMLALKYLRHIQRSLYNDALKAKPLNEIRNEMEALMLGYLSFILERKLNSPEFLREIRN
jgi:DNA repair protein RecO (recombination protein O)